MNAINNPPSPESSNTSTEVQNSNTSNTSTPPAPPLPRTKLETIQCELAAELYSLATTGKSASTPVNPNFSADKCPIIFRTYADKLPEAIDNYLHKPVKEYGEGPFPYYRESAPRDLAISVPLDEIPLEHQEIIFQWTEQHTYERTLERLLYPPPIGLGIKTSIASLQRLRARRDTAQRVTLSAAEAQLINEAQNSEVDFIRAAERLLRVRTLETTMKPDSKTSELRDLFQIIDRIRARNQAERKLVLAERDHPDLEDPEKPPRLEPEDQEAGGLPKCASNEA